MSMTNDLFSAGARLTDHPSADPSRQAVASLRGYAYQLYASGLAWMKLHPHEYLYLEVAEDYAILAQSSLDAVQVKDTKASGTVTLNHKDIRKTIEAFVDLVARNPNRQVTVRFLSTSEIGVERAIEDRVEGIAGLAYWKLAADVSDVEPLRVALERLELNEATKKFINGCSGSELRERLLKKIQWDCGKADIKNLVEDLESDLISWGASECLFGVSEVEIISDSIITRLLHLAIGDHEKDRCLTLLDFRKLVDSATKVSIGRNDFARLIDSIAQSRYPGTGHREFSYVEELLEAESLLPLPNLLVAGRAVVDNAKSQLIKHKVVSITGATGMGKTIIARQVSKEIGGNWFVLDARDTASEAVKSLIQRVTAEIGVKKPQGIIIDDANFINEGVADRAVGKLIRHLNGLNVYLLLTSYKPIKARPSDEFRVELEANVAANFFTEDEVKLLVKDAGGAEEFWGSWVFYNTSRGHPQLVMATIRGLQARRWPAEVHKLEIFSLSKADIESEQDRVRQLLVNTLPEPTKTLLYRLSLLYGQFDRHLALVTGEIDPQILLPGEQLDRLIGPWIDQVARKEFRVSPLILNSGKKVLSPQEVKYIHKIVAEELASGELLPSKVNAALLHGLDGESSFALMIIANCILIASSEDLRESGWYLFSLIQLSTSKPIYLSDPVVSSMLRLSQLLLRIEVDTADSIRKCWIALQRECAAVSSLDSSFEKIILMKVLLASPIVEAIPEWPALLLRLDSLLSGSENEPQISKLDGIEESEGGSITSVIFINQIRGIQSSQDLYELVQQLEKLSISERYTLLADIKNVPAGMSLISGNPWFNESKSENPRWETAHEYYWLVAESFFKWGFPELSIEYHIVRSVIIDEFGGNYQAAVIALMKAEEQLGPQIAFIRQRAHIISRHDAQEEGISLLRAGSGFDKANVLLPEQAFWLRDEAISFASAGKWAQSKASFEAAQQAAAESPVPEMQVMAIGLRADASLAACKADKTQDAIRLLMTCLKELQFLDPIQSTNAAYCHRVVRHGLLWMLNIVSDGDYLIDGLPPKMVAGMCSNPTPPESIKKLPLAPLATAWYLLTEIDLRSGGTNGVDKVLKEMLQEDENPVMELGIRRLRLEDAIKGCNSANVFSALQKYADVRRYIAIHQNTIFQQDPVSPLYVKIPTIELETLSGDASFQDFIRSVIIAFGFFVALEGGRLPYEFKLSAKKLLTYSERLSALVDVMAEGRVLKGEPGDVLGLYIYKVSQGIRLSIDDTFEACVSFIYAGINIGILRNELLLIVSAWVRSSWVDVLKYRGGELRDKSFLPAIIECLRMPCSLYSAVMLLFAAERSTGKRLSTEQRAYLMSHLNP